MAENNVLSFSKKKSDRRKALKQFYKLQESNRRELENLHANTSQQSTLNDDTGVTVDQEAELTLANFDEYVRTADFKTLLAKENGITEELNANQSEIKSIIYNNYYELIKINNYLENLKKGAEESSRRNSSIVGEEDDTNEFTIGIDDDDEEDNSLKILHRIKDNVSSFKEKDLRI